MKLTRMWALPFAAWIMAATAQADSQNPALEVAMQAVKGALQDIPLAGQLPLGQSASLQFVPQPPTGALRLAILISMLGFGTSFTKFVNRQPNQAS